MIPFIVNGEPIFNKDEYVFIPNLKTSILNSEKEIKAYVLGDTNKQFTLSVGYLTNDEEKIIVAGCIINYNQSKVKMGTSK